MDLQLGVTLRTSKCKCCELKPGLKPQHSTIFTRGVNLYTLSERNAQYVPSYERRIITSALAGLAASKPSRALGAP